MSLRRALLTLGAAFLLLAAPMQTASAVGMQLAAQQTQPLSLSEAAKLVQKQVGGRVLAAETVQRNGQTYYLIRILVRRGQVKVYRVDPASGRIF